MNQSNWVEFRRLGYNIYNWNLLLRFATLEAVEVTEAVMPLCCSWNISIVSIENI